MSFTPVIRNQAGHWRTTRVGFALATEAYAYMRDRSFDNPALSDWRVVETDRPATHRMSAHGLKTVPGYAVVVTDLEATEHETPYVFATHHEAHTFGAGLSLSPVFLWNAGCLTLTAIVDARVAETNRRINARVTSAGLERF